MSCWDEEVIWDVCVVFLFVCAWLMMITCIVAADMRRAWRYARHIKATEYV